MRKTLLIALAVVILAAGAFAGVRYFANRKGGVSVSSIPVSGGVSLAATVFKPKGAGVHPLIVMPSAWGARQTEYVNVGGMFARAGFVVVTYTQRGFYSSGGQIDFAGPKTVADVSSVIDWAIRTQHADAGRVGMLGQSYGAGVSLLGAEHDPRIKAVVALSTWGTWGGTFIQNGTLVARSLQSLIGGGSNATRHFDADISTLSLEYATQPDLARSLIAQLSPVRSPIEGVAALNKNKTAVMLANGFQDALLNASQVVALYGKLTGPKRLQLATGDHGQPELAAFVSGKPEGPLSSALKWMQHYLQGADNGIQAQAPIQVQDGKTGATRDLKSWPAGGHTTTLARPGGSKNYGASTASWTALLGAGPATGVSAPLEQSPLVSTYRFPVANLKTVNPVVGLRWDLPAQTSPRVVQGTAQLSFAMTGNAPAASVFAYLYDVNPAGVATLMSVTPLSLNDLSKTTPKHVSMAFTPTAWTVAKGDHVSVVLTARDPKWTSLGKAGEVVGVASTPSHPAQLTLPS